MHYCAYEDDRFPEGDFVRKRGGLFTHKGTVPLHTDDGALDPRPPVLGPERVQADLLKKMRGPGQ